MASIDTDRTLVYVGVDIGTTYTGFAFRFKCQDKIFVNNNWGQNVGFQTYKVPTCVLTDDHDNFVAFGFDAQSQYMDDDDSDSYSDDSDDSDYARDGQPKRIFHLYDEFKMKLQGEKTLDKHVKLCALDGHLCDAITIFAMTLRHLKEQCFVEINKHNKIIPNDDEIKWVLTVPCIWSDSAKQFMRQCATEAGLVNHVTSQQLVLAVEPEAAALYCKTLDIHDFKMKQNISSEELGRGLPGDSQYLIVDCGGGTVDVTAHHFKANGKLCELYAASGGGWGGRNVNIQFENLLGQVMGNSIIEIYKHTCPTGYLNDKVQFEKQKRSLDFQNETLSYMFPLSYTFIDLCQRENNNKNIKTIIKANVDEHYHDYVCFRNGYLKFSKQALLDIFLPSVLKIKNHVLDLICRDELKMIKYIYLVGGFSDCSLLQKEMKEEFTKGFQKDRQIHVILAPYEAALAVVKGAVLFGLHPQSIASRRARRFYCFAKATSSASGKCRDQKLLVPIITQNEEIYDDNAKVVNFYPYSEGNIFKLYHYKQDGHTRSKTLKYSIDIDVDVIEIDLSNIIESTCSVETKVSIYLYFGGTEIQVTARNDTVPAMNTVTQSIDCLSHY